MVRKINGKNVPIGNNESKSTGEISFYDVGLRHKVNIPRSRVTSKKLANGKYQLTSQSSNTNKAGKHYNLSRFASSPA